MPACTACGVDVMAVRLDDEIIAVDQTVSSMGTRYRIAKVPVDGPMVVEPIPDRIEASGFRRHDETCSRR